MNDFDQEELLKTRKAVFEYAKEKCVRNDQIQDGDTAITGTLKARRSAEAVADDIKDLCLFVFNHRPNFPKACLSNNGSNSKVKSTLKTVAPDDDAMTSRQGANAILVPTHLTMLEKILLAVNQTQQDIIALDVKFSGQISALF